MTKCPDCNGKLVKISKERVLPDPPFEDMTDDQLADFFCEEITGEYPNWGVTEIILECKKCGKKFTLRKK